MKTVDEILDRIKELKGFGLEYGSDKLLANFLGVLNTSLSTWRDRSRADFGKILRACEGMDLEDIFYGNKKEKKSSENNFEDLEIKFELIKQRERADIFEKLYKELLEKENKKAQ